MLCPEAYLVPNETVPKEDEETCRKKSKKIPAEGTGSLELNSYKNPKTWKKSISNFFRNQLRPTKSNDVSYSYSYGLFILFSVFLCPLFFRVTGHREAKNNLRTKK